MIKKSTITWLPVYFYDAATGLIPLAAGATYDVVGVWYKKPGNVAVVNKVMTTNDFYAPDFGGAPYGIYMIRFSAAELDTVGKFYWWACVYTSDTLITPLSTEFNGLDDISQYLNDDTYSLVGTVDGKADTISTAVVTTIPGTLTDIKGSGFATGTDSLKILSDNIDSANSTLSTINTATGTTIPNHLTDIKGASFATGTDSLKILSDNLDTANSTLTTINTATGTTIPTAIAGVPALVWTVTTRTLSSFGTLVADIATAVWGATTRTLSSFGTLVADVWANTTRTLTAGTKDASIDAILIDTAAIQAVIPATTIASEANATTNTAAILAKDADLRTTSEG